MSAGPVTSLFPILVTRDLRAALRFYLVKEPADQPWGERIARVLDPDGNVVVLGQR